MPDKAAILARPGHPGGFVSTMKHPFLALLLAFCFSCIPASSRPLPADIGKFGVQVKVEDFGDSDAEAIRRLGFGFVRLGVWTDALDDPNYRAKVDRAFDVLKRHSLKSLVTVRQIKPMRRNGDPHESGIRFAKQVMDFARTFQDAIFAVELWNEPDFPRNWTLGNYEDSFPAFMQGACKQLTEGGIGIPVMGFAFAKAPGRDAGNDKVLDSVTRAYPGCLSAVSFHTYTLPPAEIGKIAAHVDDRYGLPSILSEWGVPATANRGGQPGQARHIAGFLKEMRSTKVRFVSLYQWKDPRRASNEREGSLGVRNEDGRDKIAIGELAKVLHDLDGGD